MANNLKLITTETFGDLSCNFYRNMNDDILLTREQIGTALEEEQECVYYTQRGIMEICRFSRQPKANQFMDWVWDIVEKYRDNKLIPSQQINMTPITEAITSMSQAITTLTTNMAAMQQDIQNLCFMQ